MSSVILIEESKALINPSHPEAVQVRSAMVRRGSYDGRLVT
jgi:hypothetical protein